MQDVVDHALDSAEIAQLIAKTAAIIESNKRFHYFGTPEFHKRLCRLNGQGVAKIVPARMASVVGAPPDLFAEFVEHFSISGEMALLYAGGDRVVAIPRR
jgi:hypothetical protein